MTPAPELPDLWRQQPKETDVAYGAFVIYRDMPVNERSAVRVGSEYGRNMRLIERWQSQWFWVERARAYAAHLDEQHRKGQLLERAKMSERQAAEAQVIQRVLFAPARALAVKLADLIDREALDALTLEQLYALTMVTARLWPAVARAEREARGAPLPEYVAPEETPEAAPSTGMVLTEEFLADVHFALEQANLRPTPQLEAPDAAE